PRSAIANFERAVDRLPAEQAPYEALITLLRDEGEKDRAIDRLREYARIPGLSPDKRRRCAMLMDEFGLPGEAMNLYREIAGASGGGQPIDGLNLAYALLRRGRLGEAQTAIDQLEAQGDALSVEVWRSIANYYALVDDLDGALERLGRLEPRVGEASACFFRASLLRRHDEPARALEEFRRAYALDPSLVENSGEYVMLLLTQGRADDPGPLDEAIAVIDRTSQAIREDADTNDDEALLARFGMLRDAANRIRAGSDLDGLMSILAATDPKQSDQMVALYTIVQDFDQERIDARTFEARLRAFVDAEPRFYPAWSQLVTFLSHQGRTTEAADQATRAMTLIPADPRVAELAAWMLIDDGRYDQAMATCREWERMVGPEAFPVHETLAVAQVGRAQWQ
ncbi:MAG: hypothetical protein KDA28_00830, partial [Phycisphaerales bacterium]|nr:hypothetical protein [Phycisphaerales bacterium]